MAAYQYTTIYVLIAGVFGGLGVVILFILLCKHCSKKSDELPIRLESEHLQGDGDAYVKMSLLERGKNDNKNPSGFAEKRLQRQKEIRVETLDFSGQMANYDDGFQQNSLTNHGWKGVITVERADRNDSDLSNQWSIEREETLGRRSRPSSRLNLHASSSSTNYGSRRTLQSSLDSSVCTDNRSEITVIEIPPGERPIMYDQSKRSASHDDTKCVPTASPRMHLSAFRPLAPRRRQSSHSEINRPHEKLERLIKSHDESMNFKLQKQKEVIGSFSRDGSLKEPESSLWKPIQSFPVPPKRFFHPVNRDRSEHSAKYADNRDGLVEPALVNTSDCSKDRRQSYENIWKLRSTFEDETSPTTTDQEAEISQRPTTPTTNKNVVCNVTYTSIDDSDVSMYNPSIDYEKHDGEPINEDLLHPPDQNYFNRRQQFQRVLRNRGKGNCLDPTSSTDRSFEDSFDTTTTDGLHSSDSSRVEVTTTSFESNSTTNDFTDSSNDSQSIKRQQMKENKDDSGYKSLEATLQCLPGPSGGYKATTNTQSLPKTSKQSFTQQQLISQYYSRTASKRRRDFHCRVVSPNDHKIRESRSSFELETTDSNHPSGDSFDDSMINYDSPKYSLFNKMFGHKRQKLKRDYTVDKKTDALFKEFTRYDPSMEIRRAINDSNLHALPAYRSKSNPSIRYAGRSDSNIHLSNNSHYQTANCYSSVYSNDTRPEDSGTGNNMSSMFLTQRLAKAKNHVIPSKSLQA